MTRSRQLELFSDFFTKACGIMRSKSEDYATEDVLSNFKGAGNNIGLSAPVQCLSLISTKVARLGVLLQSKKVPNNESVLDSVLDLQIYSFLLSCLLEEEKPEMKIEETSHTWEGFKITDQQKLAIEQIEKAGYSLFGNTENDYIKSYIKRIVLNLE